MQAWLRDSGLRPLILRATLRLMDGEFFFRQLDDDLFEATHWTRGPWSAEHQHGGPPSALVAGRLEEMAGDQFRVSRIAVEITRPVSIGKLRLERSIRRDGRTVKALVGQLFDDKGKLVLSAEALAFARTDLDLEEGQPPMDEGLPEDSLPVQFPFFDAQPGYAAATELRFARGAFGQGDVMAWIRMRGSLLEGAEPSGLERVVVAADSGNGVSVRIDPFAYTFVNPDLTVTLHQQAEGEWIGLAARTDFDEGGAGLADARLYDSRGPIGRGVQTLLIRKRDKGRA